MSDYRPTLAAASYLVGIVAVAAAILDDGENDLYTFHVWQALLVNVTLGVLAAVGAGLVLPQALLALPAASRAGTIITVVPGLILGLLLLLAYPAYMAYRQERVRIPVFAPAADRMVRSDVV